MEVVLLVLGVMVVVLVYLIAVVLRQEDEIKELEEKISAINRQEQELKKWKIWIEDEITERR